MGLSHAWVDARRELVDVWLLSPLSVVPQRPGAGIGTRLVAAAVDAARSSGTPLLFLEGDPGYYGARGFERADRSVSHRRRCVRPAPAFQVVRFDAHEEWMTGQLVYRDVWWRHDAAGLRDPLLAQIEKTRRAAMKSETREYRTGDAEVVLDITDDCAGFVAGRGRTGCCSCSCRTPRPGSR